MLWTSAPITTISLTTGWEWADSSRSRQTGWEWCMGDGRITLDRSRPWVSEVYLGASHRDEKHHLVTCVFNANVILLTDCSLLYHVFLCSKQPEILIPEFWNPVVFRFSLYPIPMVFSFLWFPILLFQTSPEYNCLCINREVSVTVTLHFFLDCALLLLRPKMGTYSSPIRCLLGFLAHTHFFEL
jgi:hypothetical protein